MNIFCPNPDGANFKACSMQLAPSEERKDKKRRKKKKEKFEGFASPAKSIGLLS